MKKTWLWQDAVIDEKKRLTCNKLRFKELLCVREWCNLGHYGEQCGVVVKF